MPRTVVLDEWFLTFRIPVSLPDRTVTAIRRTLNGKAFTAALRQTVVGILRRYPPLATVRVVVGR